MPTSIDPILLSSLLRYDTETGQLYWRYRSYDMFGDSGTSYHHMKTWNTKYSDKEAFTIINRSGYRTGTLFGQTYLAHRIAWTIHTGAWPSQQIDHIDGNRANNKIANLREASSKENNRNTSSRPGSSSSYLGVSWQKQCKKWKSTIRQGDQVVHLGLFLDEDAAARAYDSAAIHYHGRFARLNFPAPLDQVA